MWGELFSLALAIYINILKVFNSVLTVNFYFMKLIYRKRGEKSIGHCTEIGRPASKFSEEVSIQV